MLNTDIDDILPKRIGLVVQYKHTRSRYGELRVIDVDRSNRTFTGEECKTGIRHENLSVDDHYFFEFV